MVSQDYGLLIWKLGRLSVRLFQGRWLLYLRHKGQNLQLACRISPPGDPTEEALDTWVTQKIAHRIRAAQQHADKIRAQLAAVQEQEAMWQAAQKELT